MNYLHNLKLYSKYELYTHEGYDWGRAVVNLKAKGQNICEEGKGTNNWSYTMQLQRSHHMNFCLKLCFITSI